MTGRTGKYQDLGRIMEFIYNSEKFTDWKTWEIRNAVGYAVEHQKYFLHWRQLPGHYKECLGFCTWGFFKREEIGNLINLEKERSIDVIITRLRKKIEENPKSPKYLQTIRGEGYVLWIK